MRSSTYSRSAGSAPEFKVMTCSITSSRADADDLSLIVDARLNRRHRHDAVVEHGRERPIDVAFGNRAKPPRRVGLEGEADRGAVELVDRLLRSPQIVAGERRRPLDDIEGRSARLDALARCPAESRGPAAAPGRRRGAPPRGVANGPRSTSVSRSCAVDLMICFARSTSETPGSCTRIWSAAV